MPPAPPQEAPPEAVEKVRAVSEVLNRLGSDADPARVAEEVKDREGIDVTAEEVRRLKNRLTQRS